MGILEHAIESNILVAWITLITSFIILAKAADIFVDSSVLIAVKLKIPRLIIGIVLVSLATTAPELTVSLMAALRGEPQMALGNAIGSVICDDGLALGLAGILATTPILIIPGVLRTSGIFLLSIEILTFLFVFGDNTLNRGEGVVLVGLFICYIILLYIQSKKGVYPVDQETEGITEKKKKSIKLIILLFFVSVSAIVLSSEFIITSATAIALSFHIPEAIIALTLVALGTSIPEVATCISAARKNEGAIAVGNILGADIMNICWVAGASAIANDLTLEAKELYFMFPAMFIIVGAMLIMFRIGYRHTRTKGFILLTLYIIYLIASFSIFPPHS
jgi:cation:H+ antiporter